MPDRDKTVLIYEFEKKLSKYWHYGLIVSTSTIALSLFGLLNGYFHFFDVGSYTRSNHEIPFSNLFAGYFGVFISIFVLPIPDYVLIPLYGYLSSIGIFNPFTVFLATLVGAIIPLEYAAGRFAGRPLLLRFLSYFGIRERDIGVTDTWLQEHGKFSIFMATFIPYFYTAASLAAGTLKMKFYPYMITSTAGFAIRYVILEYLGYYSIFILTPEYDYSHRDLFIAVLVGSTLFSIVYGARNIVKRTR